MSSDEDQGRESNGDDVEVSVRVSETEVGYELRPQIGNYEQFEVAVRLTFPIPDDLDDESVSPAASETDVWQLADRKLVLIEGLEWASSVRRACSIGTQDRSQIESIVDGATAEISDRDGTEVAVRSEIETHLPPRRANTSEAATIDRSDAGSETGEASDDATETTAQSQGNEAPGQGDSDAGDGPSTRSAEIHTGPTESVSDEAPRQGSAHTVEREDSAVEPEPEPEDGAAKATGTTEDAGDDSENTAPPTQKSPDDSRGFPPGLERAHEDDSQSTGADASSFEWADIEYGKRDRANTQQDPETADRDETTNPESEGTDRVSDSDDPDGLIGRVRSLFSE